MVVLMVILDLHVILFFSAKHDSIKINLCFSSLLRDCIYRKKITQSIITIRKYQ